MRRRVLIGATAVAVILVVGYGALQISRSRNFQLIGDIVSQVETSERVVALTFDDGPAPEATTSLLAVLRDKGVRSTFFVVGAELKRNPELGRLIVQGGHELGNHSYSHKRLVFKSLSFIAGEILQTDQLIREAGFEGPIQFRPPYGKKLVMLPYYLKSKGRKSIMANLQPDSIKSVGNDANMIVRHVESRVVPGSIILLHVMYKSNGPSLEAVPGIIDALHSQGYSFVTVSELLSKTPTGL